MTKISQLQSLQGVNANVQPQKSSKDDIGTIIFPKSEPKAQEQPKYLRPGSFDINEFSHSKRYVNGELKDIYTDVNGNKYVSISGADLVLLNQVKSGNLFHKARYETSLSYDEYNKLVQNTIYDMDDSIKANKFPREHINAKTLKNYRFEMHPAKKNVGFVTVNGEKMLIHEGLVSNYGEDNKTIISQELKVSLTRQIGNNPIKFETLDFQNIDELKQALNNKDYNFGQYQGITNINDIFIP